MLIGDQRRTCTNEGRWDLPVYGYTECLRECTIRGRCGMIVNFSFISDKGTGQGFFILFLIAKIHLARSPLIIRGRIIRPSMG